MDKIELEFGLGELVYDIVLGGIKGYVTGYVFYYGLDTPQYRVERKKENGDTEVLWIAESRLAKE